MKDSWAEHYARYFGERNLNLGAGADIITLPGWENHDLTRRDGVTVIGDINAGHYFRIGPEQYQPLKSEYHCILASHCLEHVEQRFLMYAVAKLYDLLKPGGHLIAITPYGMSDAAWENPHHRQLFTEMTWPYFTQALYAQPDHSGHGASEGEEIRDWRIVDWTLVPYPEFIDDPEIEWKRKHLRNVINEIHVVMRKPREGE